MKRSVIFISLQYNKREEGISIHIARIGGKGIKTYKYSQKRTQKIMQLTEGTKTLYYEYEMIIYPYK